MKVETRSKQAGFTIVELMISTVVFSLVLIICLNGMVQVSRAYYKGITHSRTQEATRNLMEEISQTIALSGSSISFMNPVNAGPEIASGDVDDGIGAFCAGNRKYTYAIDRKVEGASDEANKAIKNALVSENLPCTDTITADIDTLNSDINPTVNGARSLLSEDMRLTRFSVSRVAPDAAVETKTGSQLWRIEITVAYGDNDLLDYTDDQGANRVICRPGTGDEFCSTVEMSTIVARRIG